MAEGFVDQRHFVLIFPMQAVTPALAVILLVGASSAQAEPLHGQSGRVPELLTVQADPRYHDCTCRDQSGRSLRIGDTVCLATPNGSRIAICDMVLNNSSWITTDRSCHPELTQ